MSDSPATTVDATDAVAPSPAPAPLSATARAELHDRASALITALCGGDAWRMSIPADPVRDSDILLTNVLTDAQAVATQYEAVGTTLDVLGVPRSRQEQTFSLEERLSLFVDRLSERLHTQVENNMIYFNLCREVAALLKGSPNASQFRVKSAIAKLEAATIPSGQKVQSLSLLDS